MILTRTPLDGVFAVTAAPHADESGHFARTYCAETFARHGLAPVGVQCNTSFNPHRGTLRGMHYQDRPRPDPKLVRCTRGRIFDVAVDIRPDSPSYCRWFGIELSAEAGNALYVPPGCAHGFITLEESSEVFYMMGETFVSELARGVRWNDSAFAIVWPLEPVRLAPRDAGYADFQP
ncbi:MAG: dTDP-4-dehydrorhamnose 3,5-epimerase family protein [Rhodospirillales bacterium]|nr:dTDP-4-dehydrorhamnose 3,5-epimerase family protein [Rhodospirillales bacterium]